MGVKQKKDPVFESKPSVFGCTFNLESLTIRGKASTPWEDVAFVSPQRGL